MRTTLLLTMGVLPLFGIAQQTIELEPNIKAVTVFHVGAEITSESKLSIDQGQHVIILRDVSPRAVKENIRANFKNNTEDLMLIKSSVIVQTDTVWDKIKVEPTLRQTALDSAVSLRKEYTDLGNDETVLSNQYDLMKQKMQEVEMKTVDDAARLFDLYETRVIKIQTRLMDTREKRAKLQPLVSRYEAMASTKKPMNLNNKVKRINRVTSLKLVVKANRALSGNLVVKYIVGATGWAPKYQLKADTEDQKVDLRYMANIMNQSGKDWTDVKIKLSSAFPLEKIPSKPKLDPWVLSNRQDSRQYASQVVSKQNVQKEYSVDPLDNVEYMSVDIPSVTQEFNISDKHSILSDGEVFTLYVDDYTLPAAFNYHAVPAMDNNSFLVAGLTEWESVYLVSGKAEIVMNGTYIGDTYLDPRTLNDTLQITLGRDNVVMIDRTEIEGEISKKEGNKIKQTFAFKNSVKNNSKQPNYVTIEDQIPISQLQDIKVDVDELSGGELDEETGIITWRMTLKPKQKKDFTLKYTLEYPADKARKIAKGHKYRANSYGKSRRSLPKF